MTYMWDSKDNMREWRVLLSSDKKGEGQTAVLRWIKPTKWLRHAAAAVKANTLPIIIMSGILTVATNDQAEREKNYIIKMLDHLNNFLWFVIA